MCYWWHVLSLLRPQMVLLLKPERCWIQALQPHSFLNVWYSHYDCHDTHITSLSPVLHAFPVLPLFIKVINFSVLPTYDQSNEFNVVAIIVPRVTCDLPLWSIYSATDWSHIEGITLADSRIDILLSVEIFSQVSCSGSGRRTGVRGTPNAFETQLGWVLAGAAELSVSSCHVMVDHAYMLSGVDL